MNLLSGIRESKSNRRAWAINARAEVSSLWCDSCALWEEWRLFSPGDTRQSGVLKRVVRAQLASLLTELAGKGPKRITLPPFLMCFYHRLNRTNLTCNRKTNYASGQAVEFFDGDLKKTWSGHPIPEIKVIKTISATTNAQICPFPPPFDVFCLNMHRVSNF